MAETRYPLIVCGWQANNNNGVREAAVYDLTTGEEGVFPPTADGRGVGSFVKEWLLSRYAHAWNDDFLSPPSHVRFLGFFVNSFLARVAFDCFSLGHGHAPPLRLWYQNHSAVSLDKILLTLCSELKHKDGETSETELVDIVKLLVFSTTAKALLADWKPGEHADTDVVIVSDLATTLGLV